MLTASGVESPWQYLTAWEEQVASAVIDAVDTTCPPGTRLHTPAARIVRRAQEVQGPHTNRLFPLAVLGALAGDPEPAVPVAVVSTLWWAGAEALDDLSDGATDAAPAELLMGGVACLELIPRHFIDRRILPQDVRDAWNEEMIVASVHAASGQLADTARDADALAWARVMATYVGKTGAAYARDAVMAARLATSDTSILRAWRALGQLFGVLRQMHNDNTQASPEDDEDLADGTPTLLLAHALEIADPAELLGLRAAATHDLGARAALRDRLHEPDITSGYTGKLTALHHQVCALLDSLTGPSVYRDAIRSRMDASAYLAVPRPRP